MKLLQIGLFIMTVMVFLQCGSGSMKNDSEILPPKAEKRPVKLEKHEDVRIDNYYWLRERENPEVIAYLENEYDYTEAMMAHTESLQDEIFEEIRGRIKEDDSSVPYLENGYYYYTRYEEEKEYPIYCRKKGSLDAEEEIILNVNDLAEGHDFYNVRGLSVSPNNDLLAFGADTTGRRIYTIQVKNLKTGELYNDRISNVTGNVVWANDNITLFYSSLDLETLRWDKIYRHTLGENPRNDDLVYTEKDSTFYVFVEKSKSKEYLFIGSTQTLTTEFRYLKADNPNGEFQVVLPREREHEYYVSHYGDYFYIKTNRNGASNYKLARMPINDMGFQTMEDVIPHREDVLLQDTEMFSNFLVVNERKNGLVRLRIITWDGDTDYYVDFGEAAYDAWLDKNPEFDTETLRFGYSSLTTPKSIYAYDMVRQQRELLKRDEILGDFNSADYVTERLYAPSRDGKRIRISVVYRKGTPLDGTSPLFQYGYGSYGHTIDPSFRVSYLSLLDRGFVIAIAHIRGSQTLGRQWYEDGKLLNKKNTFNDFIDCGEYLIEEKYGDPEHMYAMGGSAGGLLMGAVVNQRPDLYNGVLAMVPFVDVVTTMLDERIPLTTSEYDEWGNPNIPKYYRYILSYSPYDNVESKAYPNMLVTTGLHDSQVQYWEPAKWVAKMRDQKTDDNRLLLKTNMEAGHGGASGRYERYRELAFAYAFIIDLADRSS